MPVRKIQLVNGHYYHVYNRGVEKRSIFGSSKDFQRFIDSINYYQFAGPKPRFSYFLQNRIQNLKLTDPIVEVIAFCLMPNHFHLLVRQVEDGAISEFLGKVGNSYTKYYNLKYKRVGPLFQGEFKSVFVESENQLIHLSRYIHLNPLSSFLTKNLKDWPWSSYKEYIGKKVGISSTDKVLNFFPKSGSYEQFVLDQADYAQSLEIIKHQTLED